MIPSDPENSRPVRGSGVFLADVGYADPDAVRERFLAENEINLALEDGLITTDEADARLADIRARTPLTRA